MSSSLVNAYQEVQAGSTEDLVVRYAPLVNRIAFHLKARLPQSVQHDDLCQAGMLGLLEAATKYDAGKGASFETYAGIRIKGAMLDEIRRGRLGAPFGAPQRPQPHRRDSQGGVGERG